MSITCGLWRTVKSGASNLKVSLLHYYTGESSATVASTCDDGFKIENFGKIRVKWDIKICEGSQRELTQMISISKCDSNDSRIIKSNIECEDLNFFKTGIHTPETWSEWILMGSRKLYAKLNKQVFLNLMDFQITMYEVNVNNVSPITYADIEFTDFSLSTAEGSVPVHKACLASHSDVFKAMLRGEWKETAEGQIQIKGVTLKTLQQLKDYMYLGTLPHDDISDLRPLLLIARCYLIEDLEKHCIRMLAEAVTPEELFSLIEFACENQIPELPFTLLQLTKDSVIVKAHKIKKNSTFDKTDVKIVDVKTDNTDD